MPLLRVESFWSKNVHMPFPKGKREAGEGEGVKNRADGTIYSELALTEV